MRILLVDDERELVSALAERFGFRGINADYATSGEEAIVKARITKYDLAVLDVKMPKMSGLELSKQLLEITPDLKCIFLTGHGSKVDFAQGADRGAAYLVKPVNIDLLVKEINKALGTGKEG